MQEIACVKQDIAYLAQDIAVQHGGAAEAVVAIDVVVGVAGRGVGGGFVA